MHATDDTIVAVSSPPGRSRRGLVRWSGGRAIEIMLSLCDRVERPAISPSVEEKPGAPSRQDGASLPVHENAPPRGNAGASTFHALLQPHRSWRAVTLASPSIPALLACFPGTRTYTGQPMAELQVPGHPALLDRVLRQSIDAGARLAEPGEFTLRAYLAGRIDLTQAEGVAAAIAATGDAQLAAANNLRAGSLGRDAAGMVDSLATNLALVEAGIDFTDQDDVVSIAPEKLDGALRVIQSRLDDMLARARPWAVVESPPRVVLVGPPSAGKSTLFNALLGRTRAVVSETPGTTRDALEEPVRLRDASGREFEVMLVDVAGLDTPVARIDLAAQAAARDALARADLLLIVNDGHETRPPVPVELPSNTPSLHLRTKADLATGGDSAVFSPHGSAPGAIAVSAITGKGLTELRSALAAKLAERGVSVTEQTLVLRPRHESALRAAAASIARARAVLAPSLRSRAIERVELVAGAMREGLDELACLGGTMTPDEVIGRVFATFCVGK